ncbi:MAG TPA: hypothetical protein EYN06_01905 [Myxococcales bacterium]|nr:hypothetical protein [Myxococcales bacterium]HIN85205.1 hypothetical protein [Myxococcales bacterium]
MFFQKLLILVVISGLCGCLERAEQIAPEMNQQSNSTPHGIFAAGNWVLVSDPQLDLTKNPVGYGAGTVYVIDPQSREIVNALPTTSKNPLHFAATEEYFLVVSQGPLAYLDGKHQSTGSGSIDAFDISSLDSAATATWSIPISEAPGAIALAADYMFLGNSFLPRLYKADFAQQSVTRGPDNPIIIHSETEVDTTKPMALPDGRLAVISCNTNALYFVDPLTDTVASERISLLNNPDCAGKPECLECPIDLALHETGNVAEIYVLKSISNHVARVNLNDHSVVADWAVIGPVANKLWVHNNNLFVINSGANNLQRIELGTGHSKMISIFPVSSNPYEGISAFGQHWVTLMMKGTIAISPIASPESSEILLLPDP